MENENINNPSENFKEEPLPNDTISEATEATEDACDTFNEAENIADTEAYTNGETATENACDAFDDSEGITNAEADTDAQATTEDVAELTEEELAQLAERKRKRKKKALIITGVIVVIIAIAAYFVCAIEGIGSNTIVSNPISQTEGAEKDSKSKKLSFDNIRYENPIVDVFDKVTGKNKDIALTINGEKVDKDLFNFVVNSSGINSVYTLIQMQMISDVKNFDWNKIEEQSGLSYLELSKGMAVETLTPIYALIKEGKKNGIKLDESDEKKIDDWIAEQKANYGNAFEDTVKKSGYKDVETLKEMQRIQIYVQKVYEDASKNISKYVTEKQKNKYFSDDKVTVKHILIQFEKDENGKVTDEAKSAAKAKAEEVLAKVKAGEDFDKLVKEYNQDPGASEQGYTFANDGTMVKEFSDASFALKIGQTSGLVETTYGYHIIKRIERNITADDYLEVLSKTADVRIKKGIYNNMKITINLEDYFGATDNSESEATGTK